MIMADQRLLCFVLSNDNFYVQGILSTVEIHRGFSHLLVFSNYAELLSKVDAYANYRKEFTFMLFLDFHHQLIIMPQLNGLFDIVFDKKSSIEEIQKVIFYQKKSQLKRNYTLGLSHRELVFLRLYSKGTSDAIIGKVMNISNRTVSAYRTRVLSKLNVKSKITLLLDFFSL